MDGRLVVPEVCGETGLVCNASGGCRCGVVGGSCGVEC